jgi:tight adherence protein C
MLPIIIAILAGVAALCIGGAVLSLRAGRRAVIAQRIGGASYATTTPGHGEKVVAALDRIGNAVSSGKTSKNLKQDLANAGFHGPTASAVFVGSKMLMLFIGLTIGVGLGIWFDINSRSLFLAAICGGGALFFIPNMFVDVRRGQRRADVRAHLPDAIDLLEIAVSAGMGIDTAWNAVADEVRQVSEILADEMALTNLEIHLSTPRAEAMRHMAERTGAAELSSLVAVLIQSERFGTSMTDALRRFAQTMRETRSNRAQETAEKMAVKLILPMIVFLFPAMVMVVAGPAFMALKKALAPAS